MPKKRSHQNSNTSSHNRVRPVSSTQLDVEQVERELESHDRRCLASSQRNSASIRQSISKPNDAHFSHILISQPHRGHNQPQEWLCSNCKAVQVDRSVGNEVFHPPSIADDENNAGLSYSSSLSQPPSCTSNLNLNAQRTGRPRTRVENRGHKNETRRAKVGRPRKDHKPLNKKIVHAPLRSVGLLKFSPNRVTTEDRHRSRSQPSSQSSSEDKTTSQEDGSDRESSSSRYQVTSPPPKRQTSPDVKDSRPRKNSVSPRGRSRSGNNSHNCTPHSEHNKPKAVVSNDGSRTHRHSGGKHHRSDSHREHSRKERSYSREKKRRHSSGAKEKEETTTECVTNSWSSSKQRRERDNNLRRSSSRSDRDRVKRHRSRSSSSSEKYHQRKSSKQKTDGSYLICRLM